ncbi:MAG: CocE/NonD family hydrolase [Conexibacteraceae bacterium]|nr:CocE/NonD family hydrolase [Conexibacteraceae bacterium]
MSLLGEILARRWHLPQAQTLDVVCERDLRAEMDDGAVLLADRWVARASREQPQPTVLVRSCYGRREFFGLMYGRLLAERGLQVVMQSVRGTFGSEGTFNPFDEREDGLATLRWLREQPWHSGPIGMIGESYLGLVQWAIAADAGDDLAALSIHGSASQFHGQSFPGGSMALETSAQWLTLIELQERHPEPLPMLARLVTLRPLVSGTSLGDLDSRITGHEVGWFRAAMSAPRRDDDFWAERDFSSRVPEVTARVQMTSGWYDAFLPWQLEDFTALQNAGRPPQLIIGPWSHTQEGLVGEGVRYGLAWLRGHLLGDTRLIDPAVVKLYVTGEKTGGGWRAFERWPPTEGAPRQLWITGADRLGWEAPTTGAAGEAGAGAGGSRRYRYDPQDPTPALGGPVMVTTKPVRDNRPLEARADVITFTSEPLDATLEAIGPVRVQLWARGSEPHFDLFARVCDVDPGGASWNVCDALASVAPERFEQAADGSWRVEFDLWPIAHRFAAGHRIRLQVSSGAYPRYVRNPGTGAPPLDSDELRAVDVELLYGPEWPSSVLLPPAGPAPAPAAAAPAA